MKNTVRIWLYLLFLWIISIPAASVPEYYFSQLGIRDGLSQISVFCIYQDSDGYLWFGTQNGINKYDGIKFKVFHHEVNNPASLSDGYICCITEDQAKNIWVGTMNGLNCIDYTTGEITRFYTHTIEAESRSDVFIELLHHPDGYVYAFTFDHVFRCDQKKNVESAIFSDKLPKSINTVTMDKNGDIYIGTRWNGMYVYSSDWEFKRKYIEDPVTNTPLPTSFINNILDLNTDYILVAFEEHGICKVNKTTGQFSHFHKDNSNLSSNTVRSLEIYNDSIVMIGTFGGVNQLNTSTNEITTIKVNMEEEGSLSHFSVHSLLKDMHGTLWTGTYSAGINYHSPYFKPSTFILPQFYTGVIGKGAEDKNGNMWFATEGTGLMRYEVKSGKQTLYPISPVSIGNYESNIIKSLYLKGDSIYCTTHYGQLYLFSISTKKYKFLHDFGNFDIYTLHLDSHGRLWVPTSNQNHLCLFDNGKITNKFEADGKKVSFPRVTVIKELEPDLFLFGTIRDSLYLYDMKNKTMQSLSHKIRPDNPHDLAGRITSILSDEEYIWISTTKNGLYKFNRSFELLKLYSKNEGLPDSHITSLIWDNEHNLWAVTGNQLYTLNKGYESFESVHPPQFVKQEFTFHAASISSNGTLYFPGNRGIHVFSPQNLQRNPVIPPVYITNLFSEGFEDITRKFLKKEEIGFQRYRYYAKLNYTQKSLAIQYTALNYIHPEENNFAYKMDGVDTDWRYVDNLREAYYSNLQPGKYIFRLKAANDDSLWTPDETHLYITIMPPLYKTWWAYLLYLTILCLIIYQFIRYRHHKYILERDLHYKQLEKERIKELHEERMRMYGNFSHELRTPLTLIINPVNDLIKQVSFSQEVKDNLRIIKKNATRMLTLVNNLMDIQKYEAGKSVLDKTQFNITSFIEEIHRSFESISNNRQIIFRVESKLNNEYLVKWDEAEIEKVLYNLLSNAFKFTPEKGEITLLINKIEKQDYDTLTTFPNDQKDKLIEDSYIFIEVRDNGKGFPITESENIFKPFYSSENDLHKEISGTGIGLSLTRSIIHKHEGFIWAESSPGKSTRFMILLPDTEKQPLIQKILPEGESEEIKERVSQLMEEVETKNMKSLLIVDDNMDILEYLNKHLSEEYIIYKATNGKVALDQIKQNIPDMVISDIMMPEMNGIELCKTIKESPQWCHIPVILLSARSMVTNIKEGLTAEADDYITKPFDLSLFKTRISNLLSLREKFKTAYGEKLSLRTLGMEDPEEGSDFLSQYMEIVKANISDPDFDVSVIYQSMNMSRANFYRKVKTITGLSPIELIKNIRLEAGAKLLTETDMNVSEVARHIGFGSRTYFAKVFRDVYGVTPTEYQEKK